MSEETYGPPQFKDGKGDWAPSRLWLLANTQKLIAKKLTNGWRCRLCMQPMRVLGRAKNWYCKTCDGV